MIIRLAVPQDYYKIHEININDLGYECSTDIVKYRLENIDLKREVVYVAEIDGNVVGYVHAEVYNVLYCESIVNILAVAVSIQYRRQGIGKRLLEESEKWAKNMNVKMIRLNSGASRKDAHLFYRTLGFNDSKEQVRFIKYI